MREPTPRESRATANAAAEATRESYTGARRSRDLGGESWQWWEGEVCGRVASQTHMKLRLPPIRTRPLILCLDQKVS